MDLLIWLKKKERNSKRRGKEREHPQNAPFHISYQPTRSRIHKKQSQLLKKKKREGELMIFVTLGVFSKIQKSLRAKKNISQKYVKYEN